MLRNILFTLFALTLTLAAHADGLQDSATAKLEAMKCTGAVCGVFAGDGKPVETFAIGVANIETKVPLNIDMHFRVGSVTKLFVATAALKLVEQGKFSLDDPISKFVDGIPSGGSITLRMLGNNTSGLPNGIENKQFQTAVMAEPARDWKPRELVDFALELPPYHAPGERWRYSNTNFILLGMVIEKVTGESYRESVRKLVIEPLGLRHTGFTTDGSLPGPHPSAYRNGYPTKIIGYGKVFYKVDNYTASWTGAAGEMYSTLSDLGKAMKPLASGSLLSDAMHKELTAWINTNYEAIEYGFGVGRQNGAIGHLGDVPGFNAAAFYHPEHDRTVVVITNLSNNPDGTMPAEELAKLMLGENAVTVAK